jgi:hypothetical protein
LHHIYGELQVSDATQKLSCKFSCKTPLILFLIVTSGKGRMDSKKQCGSRECKLKYWSCKLVVEGEILEIDFTSSENGPRCKRLKGVNENKFKQLEMV